MVHVHLFIHSLTVRKLRVASTIALMMLLVFQMPVLPILGGEASGSAPLDENQPSPKISPAPFSSNDTEPIAGTAMGAQTLLVICVEFSNLNHTKSTSEIDKLVFEEVNRYYQEISFGSVTIVGRTIGWYRMNYSLSYYGRDGLVVDDPNFDGALESWWLLRDAVNAADKDVDFAAFEHIAVVHAGNGQESSRISDDIWSVHYSGLWLRTRDSRSVDKGMIAPESEARGAVPLGVFAHEFGHQLGLPDLYAYGSSKSYVGDWSLMDHGLWDGDPKGSSPAHPEAYCKIKLGWIPRERVMVVNASMNVNVTVQPIELKTNGYHAIKIPMKNMEYYLVEVRQKLGYDAYLPGSGVLISYVNERLGSGYGPVKLMDSHSLTDTLNDAAYDVGRVFAESTGKFSVTILSTDGKSYFINVDRSGPSPDITIKDIRLEPSAARSNETITIYADVVNQGTEQAANFYVNCYIDEILYTRTRMTLGAGRSTTISVKWEAAGGSHSIRFAVDPVSLAADSNRNNDALSRKIAVGVLLKLYVPKDVQATVNGTRYEPDSNNEITVGVLPGTQQINVTKTQSLGNGTRRVFVRWSDGNMSNPRTITVQSDLSFSAEYKNQYYITVNANTGSASGEGWYDESSTANIVAITPCNEVQQKSRAVFTQWSGDSAASASSLSVIVDKPYSFTAQWKNQYYLSVNSNYGSTSGAGWYDANTPATFSIQPTSEIGNDTKRFFMGWSGDTTSTQESYTITMDSPKTASATWRTQYLLTIMSSYGDPTGQGWYDSGVIANVSVKEVVDHGNGTRRVFSNWTGDLSTNSSVAPTTMDEPKRAIAEWRTQHKVSFTASGLPNGMFMNFTINSIVVNGTTPFSYSDWYDSQTTLNLNVTRRIGSGFGVYVFNHWMNSTGAKVSDIITVGGPVTLTAVYNQSFGCIIATATFESELSPEVQFLRNLRDQKIMRTFAGSRFMEAFNAWYYSFSPMVASAIASNQILKNLAKLVLYPLIGILHVSALTYNVLGYNPELAVVVTGFVASYMMGTVYFAPGLAAVLVLARKRMKLGRAVKTAVCIVVGSAVGIAGSNILQSDSFMELSVTVFVLATILLSTMVSGRVICSVSRKLNWSRLRSQDPWSK